MVGTVRLRSQFLFYCSRELFLRFSDEPNYARRSFAIDRRFLLRDTAARDMDRKNFFTDGIKDIMGDLYRSPVGRFLDLRLDNISRTFNNFAEEALGLKNKEDWGIPDYVEPRPNRRVFARPPGALPDPDDFPAACTRCGDCKTACPHGVLIMLDAYSGPVLNPNYNPCRLCKGFPCIAACPEGALVRLPRSILPKFGQGLLKGEHCLNFDFNRESRKREGAKRLRYCRKCVEACPVPDAVKFNKSHLPEFADFCTGCGLCVRACPTYPKSIEIQLPGREQEIE